MRKVIIIIIGLIIVGCNTKQEDGTVRRRHHRSILTPASSGNPYEVMVVMEDSLWNGEIGVATKEILEQPIPMLPQDEPMFHVSRVNPKRYDRITNLFRNILVVRQNDMYTKVRMSAERNVFSDPQLIITIEGPNIDSLTSFIRKKEDRLPQLICGEEINRYATDLEFDHNVKVNKKCQELFGCSIYVPQDLNKIKQGKDFLWVSNDGLSTIQNICIYSYPYVSTKMFNADAYMRLRNKIMMDNIPGGKPGQYMQTNPEYIYEKDLNIMGVYAKEYRGLWEMNGDDMGGPFVAHCEVDTINNKVITVEAFVYAPSKMKRTMIRRLEAALYTLRLPNKKINTK